MFNTFNEIAPEYDFEFSVAFQARKEERRFWNPDEMDLNFPYTYSTGWGSSALEHFTYTTMNPDILRQVRSGDYDFVLMSPFMGISNWMFALLPAGRTIKVMWSETNMLSTRYMSALSRFWKKRLMKPFEINALPGERALEYVNVIDPSAARKPIIWLPNIVDSRLFVERTEAFRKDRSAIRKDLGVSAGTTLILGIGMIFEKKGFDLTIEAARMVEGDYKIIILGDGPKREEWQKRIDDYQINDRIEMPGQVDPETVARHFAAADWFYHPARFDPSPLVVIEASNAGMPLAISKHTGNSPEALDNGRAGVELDASGPEEMAAGLRKMLSVGDEERRAMGARAAEIASEKFEAGGVVRRFYEALLAHRSE